jgi:hypothetical protein
MQIKLPFTNNALTRSPHILIQQSDPKDKRFIVFVTLISASTERVKLALRQHANSKRYRPIFIVSGPPIHLITTSDSIAEHLPAQALVTAHKNDGNWAEYLASRWRMLNLKWQPVWVIEYGVKFEHYLIECSK